MIVGAPLRVRGTRWYRTRRPSAMPPEVRFSDPGLECHSDGRKGVAATRTEAGRTLDGRAGERAPISPARSRSLALPAE